MIPVNNVKIIDRYPLCPQTLDLADKLSSGELPIESLPPIHTVVENGNHTIRDGRHRYTAIRLAGIDKIKCKYYEIKKT